MNAASLALVVATLVGLVNAGFVGVVAYEVSGIGEVGGAAAVITMIAEAVLVHRVGRFIANRPVETQGGQAS
jgi:hypothetical protein